MRYLLLVAGLIVLVSLHAVPTREELAVSLIPDSLMRGAHSVVRSSETMLEISGPAKAVLTEHNIITVLDESAADELSIRLYYDQFQSIKDMVAILYDKNGKQMNKHALRDMKDFAAYDGFSLFSDARLKYLQTSGGDYPVTIDLTVVKAYNGLMDYPDWYIQGHGQSVESTKLTVTFPEGIHVNYKSYNTDAKPVADAKAGQLIWTLQGVRPFKVPSSSYSARYYLPRIDLSPDRFQISSYSGSMASWASFGTAMAEMWRGRRTLTDSAQTEIRAMVRGAHSDREKIDILYGYLQKNFRYVSVQIGLGGWIPFSASTVHATRYGDCKALSNYMCAILGAAGVRAYPVLINAGESEHAIDTSFASNRFNHVIACAEAEGKPVWLECTSNSMPPGVLGVFTENRVGLMIGENNGHIVHTPSSVPDPNQLLVSHEVICTDAGPGKISGKIDLYGEYRTYGKSRLLLGTEKEQVGYIYNALHIKQPEDAGIDRPQDSNYDISVVLHGSKEHAYDFKTGSKSFFSSTMITKWYNNVSIDSSNKYDVLLDFPADKKEQLVYHLRPGNVSLPSDFDMDNSVLSFHRKASKSDDNTVIIQTELKTKEYIVRPENIALLKESLQKVNKYLQQKVIVDDK